MTADAAFTSFVRQQTGTLLSTAFLLTGDPGRAEELLQDTLVRLYPRWERVEAADAPVAYVRRSLVNAFLSSRRRPDSRDIAVWAIPDRVAAGDLASRVVDRDLLWRLLGTLPERQRAALVLRYFHDLTDADIAAAIGCRAVTVRSLLSRGLRALQHASTNDGSAPAVRRAITPGGENRAL